MKKLLLFNKLTIIIVFFLYLILSNLFTYNVSSETNTNNKHCISIILELKYGSKDNEIGLIYILSENEWNVYYPEFFSIDNENNIYILDYLNNKIKIFNSIDKSFKAISLNEKVYNISGLYVEKNRSLLITDHEDRLIYKYQLKGNTVKKIEFSSKNALDDFLVSKGICIRKFIIEKLGKKLNEKLKEQIQVNPLYIGCSNDLEKHYFASSSVNNKSIITCYSKTYDKLYEIDIDLVKYNITLLEAGISIAPINYILHQDNVFGIFNTTDGLKVIEVLLPQRDVRGRY